MFFWCGREEDELGWMQKHRPTSLVGAEVSGLCAGGVKKGVTVCVRVCGACRMQAEMQEMRRMQDAGWMQKATES